MQKTISATSRAGDNSLPGRPAIGRPHQDCFSFKALWLTLAVLVSPVPATAAEQEFQRFLTWFEGEFDNYEQVWQQKTDNEEDVLEHIHHIFKPVRVPALGDNVFFVKQYMDGDYDKVYRQRLYRFSVDDGENAILLTIYSFADEMKYRLADQRPAILETLEPDGLKTIPGCEVFWKWNGEFFDGYMKQDACSVVSRQTGKRIYINDTLRLTDSWIWIQDQAHDADGNRIFGHDVPHKNRKVKFYKGWMALKKHKVEPGADLSDWIFAKIGRMHSEGQKIPLLDESGIRTGYTLSLETLTYQETRTPVLKVGVIEDRTGYTLSYSWAEPGSLRVGLNVRWFQAGLTRIDE